MATNNRFNYLRRYRNALKNKRANNQRSNRREQLQIIAIGCTTALVLLLLLAFASPLLTKLSISFHDLQLTMHHKAVHPNAPLIISIDEKSIERHGQWPWPRNLIAKLLNKLHALQPAAVGIDILFSEPDRTSPIQLQQQLEKTFGSTLSLENIPEDQRDYDHILANTLSQGPNVLSFYFNFAPDATNHCTPNTVDIALLTAAKQTHPLQQLHHPVGLRCSIEALATATHSSGFINGRPDDDGIYRRVPLIMMHQGQPYPSLALQTLSIAHNASQLLLKSTSDGFQLKINQQTIPLDAAGNMLLRFPDPKRSFSHISASDILADAVNPDDIKDKIVFLGVSAVGLKDYRPNPLDPLFTGIEFHATVVENILNGEFLTHPGIARSAELTSVVLVGVLFSVLMAWSGPLAIILFALFSTAALLAVCHYWLQSAGVVVSPFPAMLTIATIVIMTALFKYWREQRRSNEITQQILLSQEATIEGFGAMAEYSDPETGGHIKRTQNYVRTLALALQDHPRLGHQLDDTTIDLMHRTAPLHDIGKIAIPDHILLKEGRLTDEEFLVMEQHTKLGADVIEIISAKVGQTEFIRIAKEIILHHQEKWDGTGYPQQLKGEEIPLSARLMAIADVYDALISRRVYKPPYSHKTAVRMITEERGGHFDPEVVDAFLTVTDRFLQIALEFLDNEEQYQVLLSEDDRDAV